MFDDPTSAQTTDTGIFGNMFDDPAPISNQTPTTTVMPEPAQFVEGQPTWSGQAIRNVMPTSSALATTLPEPTLHALREECTPGVVAAARMREEELRSTQQQTSQQTTVHRQEIEELSGFPAISSIIRSSPPPRIQNVSVKKEGRFARLAKRSLQIFQGTNGQKSISTAPRPVRIQSDDYASTYGDQDGFDDGVYAGARMLEILSYSEGEDIFEALPKLVSTPEINIETSDEEKFSIIDDFIKMSNFKDGKIIDIDGIRVEFDNGWGLLRASNTSPVLVLRFEADSSEALSNIKGRFKDTLYKIEPSLANF